MTILNKGSLTPAGRSKLSSSAAVAWFFGAVVLALAIRTYVRTSGKREVWAHEDEALDRDLETSFDASDPIGRY